MEVTKIVHSCDPKTINIYSHLTKFSKPTLDLQLKINENEFSSSTSFIIPHTIPYHNEEAFLQLNSSPQLIP